MKNIDARNPNAITMFSPDPLANPGGAEGFKAGVHFGMFALAAMFFGYNLMAASQRRDLHLKINVAVYAGLMLYEKNQIENHLRAR